MTEFWKTPVAEEIPFDNATNGFTADNLQSVIEEFSHRGPYETTATSLNGIRTLTVASFLSQYLTGTATGFSIVLPDATTLLNDWQYQIINTTSQTMSVKNNAGTILFTLSQNSIAFIRLQSNATADGLWVYWQVLSSSTASGILNYNLTSATPFSTSVRNPSMDIITGFTLTPQAGTYACWYNAAVYYTTTPKAHFWTFFKNGIIVTDSSRQQDTAHSNQIMIDTTQAIISCNGTDTIDIRVACDNTGTITVNNRTMVLIRLGP